jgi:ELWxxDGT repeat protein
MHVRKGSALVWLGLVGLGCGVGPDATDVSTGSEVEAQACPPGVATRVKVVLPPEANNFSRPQGFTDVQGTLYFAANRPSEFPTLWRSNGTPSGTVAVRTFPQGYGDLMDLVAAGSRLFFKVYVAGTGSELWTSDGTAQGTRLVKDITPGPVSSELFNAAEVNGRLVFFRAPEGGPDELWRSDGTESGTLRVRVVSGVRDGFSYRGAILKTNTALLFFRKESSGLVMWRTDGMLAGTSAVKQVGGPSVTLVDVQQEGNGGVFIVQNGVNHQVWKTDGTAGGTQLLDAFGRPMRILKVLGNRVYLSSMDPDTQRMRIQSLLLSGGGKASVATLSRVDSEEYSYVQGATVSGGNIVFSVAHMGSGPAPLAVELWSTDGTSGGTRKVYEQLARYDEYASPVFATGEGIVLFSGDDPTTAMFTRGTAATTGRLAPSGPGAPIYSPDNLLRIGSRVYFSASDDTSRHQLWSVPASFSCPAGFGEIRE